MTMHNKGLTKLMEECAELIQIAAKKAAFMETDQHPGDPSKSMKAMLEDEMGDVIAAIAFVGEKLRLDLPRVEARIDHKVETYRKWHADPSNHGEPAPPVRETPSRYQGNPTERSESDFKRQFLQEFGGVEATGRDHPGWRPAQMTRGDIPCKVCHGALRCEAGRSAYPDNWYCQYCEDVRVWTNHKGG